jgi:hypothetical protein
LPAPARTMWPSMDWRGEEVVVMSESRCLVGAGH